MRKTKLTKPKVLCIQNSTNFESFSLLQNLRFCKYLKSNDKYYLFKQKHQ